MLRKIPTERPATPLLDGIESPESLRRLERNQLPALAEELRAYLLYIVGRTGGHFGAGLGVVELTLALHYLYDTPADRIVWDVGHQTYPHKILTGRRSRMNTMRQSGGLSGFPKRGESEYDTFGVGHSSTSISAAVGMTLALANSDDEAERARKVVAVIGDGAMTGGMAIEALAHAGHVRPDVLVVLNDNQMSIGHNRGGLASYFARIWASRFYIAMREGSKRLLENIPPAWDLARRTEEHMKGMVAPGTLFEELGWHYIGPIDGHDIDTLLNTIQNMRTLQGPRLLHILTCKGKGYAPAENDPVGYHAINKIEPTPRPAPQPADGGENAPPPAPRKTKYQAVFGRWLCDMAERDPRLIAITPAMCEGSGMVEFAERFPERFHDVAIAEQHSVTLAAGMACEGAKPVLAIYSTFLQRGYDQLIHDVALQGLDVTFGIDRAGLVGEDGATHAGSFDLTYLRCLPNVVVAAPSDENECRQLLYTCYRHDGPAAVRYPRGTGAGVRIMKEMSRLPIGKAVVARRARAAHSSTTNASATNVSGTSDWAAPSTVERLPTDDVTGRQPAGAEAATKAATKAATEVAPVAILSFGVLLPAALEAAEQLDATVVDMRWVKPLDEKLALEMAATHKLLVTLEDNVVAGGAGAAVNELLARDGIVTPVLNLGLPDRFIEQGGRDEQLGWVGLDGAGVLASIQQRLVALNGGEVPLEVLGADSLP